MTFERATASTPELVALVSDARKRLESHRGGPALLATIMGESSHDDLLERLIAGGQLWVLDDEGSLQGFAVVRDHVVEAMFVAPGRRRQGDARMMITTLLALKDPPRDAYALPGDRATKSLYESIGWKARLLTMRGV